MSSTPGALVRFDRRDVVFLAACALVTAACIAVTIRWHDEASPEAALDLRVDREAAGEVALTFLADHGLGAPSDVGTIHAAAFTSAGEARVFLERSLGLEKANSLMSEAIPVWKWNHRWFTPLQKEEVSVEVTPGGRVVGWRHALPDEAPGERLPAEEGRAIAAGFFERDLGRTSGWELIETSTRAREARTDHTFTWRSLERPELEPLDASQRAWVAVAGDRVTGFGEFLHVPEAWQRDYAALRSKNATAGGVASFLMALTMLAILVTFLREAVRRNVPWRTATLFAAAGFVLALLQSVNSLSLDIHRMDTTTSMASFVAGSVVQGLAGAAALGVGILILTGAGEPLYRAQYPRHVALGNWFTRHGMRTKAFFASGILGFTLTAFFLAYQVVFYIVAGKLGAWAPQDVPFDDLLNTRFPWTAVLLIGFMPSVTEEFMSRMFSIPFLERLLKWRFVAVFVASFIWGFAHAGYPNQPFYIRGLEVGIAGVIVSYVMLRWGILATLTWHYTVDALLTGMLLLQSDNWYFRLSAGAAIGLMGFPLVAALVAYVRKGGFQPEEPLLNDKRPAPPVAVRPPAPVPPAPPAVPLPRWALPVAGLLVVGAVAVTLAPLPRLADAARVSVSRAEAVSVAEQHVRALGGDPGAFRRNVVLDSEFSRLAAKLLLSGDGAARAPVPPEEVVAEHRRRLPTFAWRVRWFQPGQEEEYAVTVRADAPVVHDARHVLGEGAPGATLEEEQARTIAADYLASLGVNVGSLSPKAAQAEQRPARRDWTFTWEDADGFRSAVQVGGDRATGHWRWLHVPEAFERAREGATGLTTALGILKTLLVAAFLVVAMIVLVRKLLAREVPMRQCLAYGGVVAAALLVQAGVAWPAIVDQYDTARPWDQFVVQQLLGALALPLFAAVGAVLVFGLAAALQPGRVVPLTGNLRDALVGATACVGAAFLIPGLRDVVGALWPAASLPGLGGPPSAGTNLPFLANFVSWLASAPSLVLAIAIAASLHARLGKPWMRVAALFALPILLLPGDARTGAEFVAGAILAVVTSTLLHACLALLRGNGLAYLLGGAGALGAVAAARLAAHPEASLRASGIALLAAVVVVLGIAARRARPSGRPDAPPA